MHEHRVPARVGDVVGDDPVFAALRGRHDPTRHAAGVRRSLGHVGHVARLQVGEGRAVADHVLQRLDVGVVDGRVVRRRSGRRSRPCTRPSTSCCARCRGSPCARGRSARGRRAQIGALDSEHVRRRVVAERHRRVVVRNRERDVRAAWYAAGAVVHVPALVDRHFGLVRACGQRRRLERRDAVAVRILEPRAQAVRLPVARAAELRLEAADRDRDLRAARCP